MPTVTISPGSVRVTHSKKSKGRNGNDHAAAPSSSRATTRTLVRAPKKNPNQIDTRRM